MQVLPEQHKNKNPSGGPRHQVHLVAFLNHGVPMAAKRSYECTKRCHPKRVVAFLAGVNHKSTENVRLEKDARQRNALRGARITMPSCRAMVTSFIASIPHVI